MPMAADFDSLVMTYAQSRGCFLARIIYIDIGNLHAALCFQVIDFKHKYFLLGICANYRKPHEMGAPGLSIGTCPQSYPQSVWIVQKALRKPRVTAFFQVLLEL